MRNAWKTLVADGLAQFLYFGMDQIFSERVNHTSAVCVG